MHLESYRHSSARRRSSLRRQLAESKLCCHSLRSLTGRIRHVSGARPLRVTLAANPCSRCGGTGRTRCGSCHGTGAPSKLIRPGYRHLQQIGIIGDTQPRCTSGRVTST